MQIGELSQRSGVSHRTIHYCERLGLVRPTEREGAGYRYYDEIAAVIDLYFEEPSGIKGKKKVLAILQGQLDKTNAQVASLASFKTDLETNIARMKYLIGQTYNG